MGWKSAGLAEHQNGRATEGEECERGRALERPRARVLEVRRRPAPERLRTSTGLAEHRSGKWPDQTCTRDDERPRARALDQPSAEVEECRRSQAGDRPSARVEECRRCRSLDERHSEGAPQQKSASKVKRLRGPEPKRLTFWRARAPERWIAGDVQHWRG